MGINKHLKSKELIILCQENRGVSSYWLEKQRWGIPMSWYFFSTMVLVISPSQEHVHSTHCLELIGLEFTIFLLMDWIRAIKSVFLTENELFLVSLVIHDFQCWKCVLPPWNSGSPPGKGREEFWLVPSPTAVFSAIPLPIRNTCILECSTLLDVSFSV